MNRRDFINTAARGACLLAVGGVIARVATSTQDARGEWVIDSAACQACGKCATHCVRKKSAVICRNDFVNCGQCTYCYGYEVASDDAFAPIDLVCPTGAIIRTPIHIVNEEEGVDDYRYQYTIDEDKCTGCGKCVKRCKDRGNKTLHLVVRQDKCDGCNQCTIARSCEGVRADGTKAIASILSTQPQA